MNFKYKYVFLAMLFLFPACKDYLEYKTADKAFTLTFPKEFKKTSSNPQADLLCVSRDNSIQMIFFSYRAEDLAETTGPETLLELQIEEFSSAISSFTKTEEKEIYTAAEKNITRVVYSGIKENKLRDFYIFSAVSFDNNKEVILTAMQVVPVGKYKQYEKILRKIVESAKANK